MLQAVPVLKSVGIVATLTPTTGPGTAGHLARTAVEQGIKLVLACGGDGTIHEIINGMIPGNAALGVLPGGTANIFARELRMPIDPLAAARSLPRWTAHRIAVGRATWQEGPEGKRTARSKHFLCLAGVGYDAYIVSKLSRARAMAYGVAAYVAEAVSQTFHYSFPPVTFRTEEGDITGSFAAIQRTERYAGWLRLAPGASIFKNYLTFCVFKSRNRLRYFRYAAAVVMRRHARLDDVELIQTGKVDCAAVDPSQPVLFELDGELAGQLPATFEIVPDALTVLVP